MPESGLLWEEAGPAPVNINQTQRGRAQGKVGHSEPPGWRQMKEQLGTKEGEPSLRGRLATGEKTKY